MSKYNLQGGQILKQNSSKERVIHAASFLFYQNGFHGTSVRDIADKAAVNVSLISYYFKSKQGLLEYAVTNYYGQYLQIIEETAESEEFASDFDRCVALVKKILAFKMEHYQLTAFIHRELSLDSTFVREMTVTYLAKENHILSKLFFRILHNKHHMQKEMLFIQFTGMLATPFMMKHEWKKHLMDNDSRQYFIKQYIKTTKNWLKYLQE